MSYRQCRATDGNGNDISCGLSSIADRKSVHILDPISTLDEGLADDAAALVLEWCIEAGLRQQQVRQ